MRHFMRIREMSSEVKMTRSWANVGIVGKVGGGKTGRGVCVCG